MTDNPRLTLDELNALERVAEIQGGVRLLEPCEGQLVNFKKPKPVKVRTCTCGNQTMFVLPYQMLRLVKRKGAEARGGGLARMCALCDRMDLMPRFAAAVERESE